MKKPDQRWSEIDRALTSLEKETDRPVQPTAMAGILYRMLKVQCDAAKITDEASTRVVGLTWCLLVLTIALAFIALIQTAIML